MTCQGNWKKNVIIFSILLVIVAVAVTLGVVLGTQNSSQDQTNAETNQKFSTCLNTSNSVNYTAYSSLPERFIFFDIDVVASESFQHNSCSTQIETEKSCEGNGKAWIVIDKNSSDYEAIRDALPQPNINFSSVLLSPSFRITALEPIHISISIPSSSQIEVHVDGLDYADVKAIVNMTSDACRYGVINNPVLMLFTFRLVVFTEDFLLTSYLIQASVTSHARPTFQDIDIFPSFPLAYPDFAVVPLGTRNVCSGEAFEQVIQCDWKIVENAGNDSFILQDFHDCIRMGITHHENDNSYRFLALSPNHPISEAYLISPIIEGGSSHFILSFYYIPRCNKTSIRAYIVPSYKYLQNSVSQFKQLVYEKHHNKSDTNWFFVFKSIETLQNYDFFQVLIDGTCMDSTCTLEDENWRTTQCRNHMCSGNFLSVLAIDDLAVEVRYDQCIVNNNNVTNIDCSFEDGNDFPTICQWNSTREFNPFFFLPRGEFDLFHWQPVNEVSQFDESDHGPNEEHLEGRGHILHFDANGRFRVDNYFRSPMLIGNTNCSCIMTFDYLLRGWFAPRLQVNLVLSSNEVSENRPIIPQWSVFGHQSDEWLVADLLLNVRTEPFQIEIRYLEGTDSRADVAIDRIVFTNCDFRRFE